MASDLPKQNLDSSVESLENLKTTLSDALNLMTKAVDQSLKLSVDNNMKRHIAKEWENTANTLIGYVKNQARKDHQNLMSWYSMINIKL